MDCSEVVSTLNSLYFFIVFSLLVVFSILEMTVRDVVEYVTIVNLLESIFNIHPVFTRQCKIQTHWVYTG
jgi:hypothetical protein